ncbi:TULIP family P47-like protein [Burkholderia alba]|uniref:TULIP family P47-like protein n=1 Tax=Burkholderia alba TaxID=2683677 RepID=UPI002B062573|nr:TULIP family P47-like protein [Burkholderia alba]
MNQALDLSNTQSTGGNEADTYGWDSVFAIHFDNANQAVNAAWDQVSNNAKHIAQTAEDDDSYKIDATFGPWQLTPGGDGKNIHLMCPIVSGAYFAGKKKYDMSKAEVIIEIGMEWVPNPDQFSFVISGNSEIDAIFSALEKKQIPAQLRDEFKKNNKALTDGATAQIKKSGLEWLISDGKINFYLFKNQDKDKNEFINVYQFEEGWSQNLKALEQAVSEQEPAVAVITIKNNPATGTIALAVLSSLTSIWFNAHISEFNHVFATLNIDPIISKSDKYGWLKPVEASYSVTDKNSLATSLFGILSKASGNVEDLGHQISPFAIPENSGANAGFLISGPMFMKNIMLGGAHRFFYKASESDFEISNDRLTIQNNKDLIFGKFMSDEKKITAIPKEDNPSELDKGHLTQSMLLILSQHGIVTNPNDYKIEIISSGGQWLLTTDGKEYILNVKESSIEIYSSTEISIKSNRFKMTLNHSMLEVSFTDALYSYSDDFDVHVNYTESLQLSLQEKDGQKIFWFENPQRNLVVNVVRTQTAITREIVLGAIAGVLSLVAIAGPVIQGLRAGATVAEVTEEAGTAIISEEVFASVEAELPAEVEADSVAAGSAAVEQAGGRWVNIKQAFGMTRWKIMSAIMTLSVIDASADQLITALIEKSIRKEWKDVPSFDEFAQGAITPYTFPHVDGFELVSANLAGSLQLGFKTKQKT